MLLHVHGLRSLCEVRLGDDHHSRNRQPLTAYWAWCVLWSFIIGFAFHIPSRTYLLLPDTCCIPLVHTRRVGAVAARGDRDVASYLEGVQADAAVRLVVVQARLTAISRVAIRGGGVAQLISLSIHVVKCFPRSAAPCLTAFLQTNVVHVHDKR